MKKAIRILLAVLLVAVMAAVVACSPQEQDPCANGHTFDEGVYESTDCESARTLVQRCKVCGKEQRTQAAPAGHQWNAGVIASGNEPTCTEDGVKTVTCEVCGETKTETVPATGHVWGAITPSQMPTCNQDGVGSAKCEVCGESSSSVVIPATGLHDWDDGTILDGDEPDCENEGLRTFTCQTCGTTSTQLVPATGHTYGILIAEQPATCTEQGTEAHYQCSECGSLFDSQKNKVESDELVIQPLQHNIEKQQGTAPKCTENGIKDYYKCTRCGELFEDALGQNHIDAPQVDPATGHKEHVLSKVDATCTEDGKTEGRVCDVCGKVIVSQKTIPALGHDWGNWYVDTHATCETDGMQHRDCQRVGCSEVDKEVINKTGHKYKYYEARPASCADGFAAHYECETCRKYFDTEYNPVDRSTLVIKGQPDNHFFDDWRDEIPATCTSDGRMGYQQCTVCHNYYAEDGIEELAAADDFAKLTIKATGHSYVFTWQWGADHSTATLLVTCEKEDFNKSITATVTSKVDSAATCTSDGQKTYTAEATFNNQKKTDTYVEKLAKTGHTKGSEYIQVDEGGLHYHYTKCTVCKERIEETKTLCTGLESWQTNGTNHWHECAVCRTHYDEATHQENYVQQDGGTHKKWCEVCKYVFAESEACTPNKGVGQDASGHKVNATWYADAEWHWQECEHCGNHFNQGAHNYGTDTDKHACTDCGHPYFGVNVHVGNTDGEVSYYADSIAHAIEWIAKQANKNVEYLIKAEEDRSGNGFTVPADYKVTIDMGGHQVKFAHDATSPIVIETGATLTLKNGALIVDGNATVKVLFDVRGTLLVQDDFTIASGDKTDFTVNGGATLTLPSGTYTYKFNGATCDTAIVTVDGARLAHNWTAAEWHWQETYDGKGVPTVTVDVVCDICKESHNAVATAKEVERTLSTDCKTRGTATFSASAEYKGTKLNTTENKEYTLPVGPHSYPTTWEHAVTDNFGYHSHECSVCHERETEACGKIENNYCTTGKHTYTQAEIVAALKKLSENGTLGKEGDTFTLTGVVTGNIKFETYDSQKEVTFDMEVDGYTVKVYRLYYDSKETNKDKILVVGCTVTVTGKLVDYEGTREFDRGATWTDIVFPAATLEVNDVDGATLTLDKTEDFHIGDEVTLTIEITDYTKRVDKVLLNGNEVTFSPKQSVSEEDQGKELYECKLVLSEKSNTVTISLIDRLQASEEKVAELTFTAEAAAEDSNTNGYGKLEVTRDTYYGQLAWELNPVNNQNTTPNGTTKWQGPRFGQKAESTPAFTLKDAIADKVTRIVVNIGYGAYTTDQSKLITSLKLYIYKTCTGGVFSNQVGEAISITAAYGENVFVIPEDQQGENYYYQIKLIVGGYSSGNGAFELISIAYYAMVTPVCDHSRIVEITETPATCTTDGRKAYYQCEICKQLFKDKAHQQPIDSEEDVEVIAASGHNVDGVDFEDMHDGNHGQKCQTCGQFTNVSPHSDGWLYNNEQHWHGCETCGYVNGEKQPHNLGDNNNAVSCLDGCGYVNSAHQHNFQAEVPQKDATCTEDGHPAYKYCTECENYYWQEDGTEKYGKAYPVWEKLGHTYEGVEFTPIPDTNMHGKLCSRCKEFYEEETKSTHTWVAVPNGKVDELYHKTHCSVCNTVGENEQHKFGDNYNADCACGEVRAATGSIEITAEKLNLDASYHDGAWQTKTFENLTFKYRNLYLQSGIQFKAKSDGKGELYNETAIPGRITKIVIVFNQYNDLTLYLGTTSNPTGNSKTSSNDNNTKTWTWTASSTDNFKYFRLYRDATSGVPQVKSITIYYEKCEHTYVETRTGGSCETGTPDNVTKTCIRCGDTQQTTEPAKHKLVEVGANDPTCTEKGNIKYYECEVCGRKFYNDYSEDGDLREIPKDGEIVGYAKHSYETEEGKVWSHDDSGHWYYCTVCQKKYNEQGEEIQEAIPHDKQSNGQFTYEQLEGNEHIQICQCGYDGFQPEKCNNEGDNDGCNKCHRGEGVFVVGTSYYSTLQEAITNSNGGMITLQASVADTSVTGAITSSFTLDLGNHDLTADLTFGSGAVVTLQGGNLKGTVTVSGGELTLDKVAVSGAVTVSAGKLTANGATFSDALTFSFNEDSTNITFVDQGGTTYTAVTFEVTGTVYANLSVKFNKAQKDYADTTFSVTGTTCDNLTAVLFAETKISHTYLEGTIPTNDNNGSTHSVVCEICGTTVHENHNFDSGDCVCGEKKPDENITVEASFVTKFTTYASKWNNSYNTERTVTASNMGVSNADFTVKMNASKQTTTIKDRPVIASKTNLTYVTIALSGEKKIKSFTMNLTQWSSDKKFVTVTLQYQIGTGEWTDVPNCGFKGLSSAIAVEGYTELKAENLPAGVTSIRLAVQANNSGSNQQLGLESFTMVIG